MTRVLKEKRKASGGMTKQIEIPNLYIAFKKMFFDFYVTSQKILVVRKKMLDKKDDMYYEQNA